MAHYLVTGGCGFIGSHLTDRLLAEGNCVTILDDLSTGRLENKPVGARLVVGDVADAEAVRQAIEGVDGVFHLAAVASVQRSRELWAETHRTNLTGAVTVFEAARTARFGEPVPVVYASSAAVYGDNPHTPLGENTPAQPLSAYGADKLGCELHARVAWEIHGVPTVGFRFFNVYGPRQDPNSPYSGVISIFARRVGRGEDVDIFGDGEQVRDFIFVDDVVRFLSGAMARRPRGAGVFNLCTGRPTSINMLLAVLEELVGNRVRRRHHPARAGDIRVSIGDPTKARTTFNMACRTGLLDGLGQTVSWAAA
ncbi:NAD-dependent epimerase/dehydratase family protein [Azospirillum sp.]|uniref:NAD-dependent epimerase/dehydratase family protein n=1 Tax=Azospirillum sp. TaxID=34012 RepID=UPI002D523087|nr:NAD-dependent epimerase/dehydratase family protein [Azospirillum sp.]HYD65835.1 NAD-dependent epimerase/dehydratase family protein [Azospirillum sp.]